MVIGLSVFPVLLELPFILGGMLRVFSCTIISIIGVAGRRYVLVAGSVGLMNITLISLVNMGIGSIRIVVINLFGGINQIAADVVQHGKTSCRLHPLPPFPQRIPPQFQAHFDSSPPSSVGGIFRFFSEPSPPP